MNNRRLFGAIVLSILLIATGGFTALSAAKGATDGVNGGDSDDGEMSEGDSVFSEAVTLFFAGITIEVGPPMYNDSDGVYEDLPRLRAGFETRSLRPRVPNRKPTVITCPYLDRNIAVFSRIYGQELYA